MLGQLIARRVREAGYYSEIVPHSIDTQKLLDKNPAALILSGGPSSVYEEGAPALDPQLLNAGVPVLGICYGFRVHGERSRRHRRQDGRTRIRSHRY